MMLAIGGPERSPECDCHSLRRLFAVRYSVLMSETEPPTCRVTIFTPDTEESGAINALVEMIKKSSRDMSFPLVPPTGYGVLFYPQLQAAALVKFIKFFIPLNQRSGPKAILALLPPFLVALSGYFGFPVIRGRVEEPRLSWRRYRRQCAPPDPRP